MKKVKGFSAGYCYGAFLASGLLLLHVTAMAATFTVTNGNDSGPGSLRQTIINVNNQPSGDHVIEFSTGLTATRTSEMEGIWYPNGRVDIEGNGATLDGQNLSASGAGLSVFAPSTIRNLTIINFPVTGLGVYGINSAVYGCYIGTDVFGADLGNGGNGIEAQNATNLAIGSTDSADANRICYNGNFGIAAVNCAGVTIRRNHVNFNRNGIAVENTTGGLIGGGGASGRNFILDNVLNGIHCINASELTIASNFIGLKDDGISPWGNGDHGIYLYKTTNCTIGGASIFLGNIICDNAESGIYLEDSDDNTILGNYIGISPYEKSGKECKSTDLGNGGDGMTLANGSTGNLVGGTGVDEPNVITFNQGVGVRLTGATTRLNVLYQNSIYGNVEGDIVVQDGANDGIAPPVITGIDPVSGTSAPNALLEVFAKEAGGEPVYIGRTFADGAGAFSWETDLTPYAGMSLIATQTTGGNTSAFSNAYPIPDISEGEGEVASEGEGEVPTEGEGEVPTEGEGEVIPEGEGEVPAEGEGEVAPEGEGEVPAEGEGEVPTEGEGEAIPEGEGEVPAEGEGEVASEGEGEIASEGEGETLIEGEGEGEEGGCCGNGSKCNSISTGIKRYLGDFLLLGVCMAALFLYRTCID